MGPNINYGPCGMPTHGGMLMSNGRVIHSMIESRYQVVHLNFFASVQRFARRKLPTNMPVIGDQSFMSHRESGSSGCSAEVIISQSDSAEAISSDIVPNQSARSATTMHSSPQPGLESTSPQTSPLSALHSDSKCGPGQNEGGDRGLKVLCAK